MTEDARPLAGTRIVSLAEQYPGPYATLILSDLGAEVIQVERPAGGDPARRYPDFYAALNRGKRSVALDLKQQDAREALLQLVAGADALLEGFRPGVMDRLGLGTEVLRKVNPDLVVVSVSGFGQDGPHRLRPAHDLSYQAMTGHLADVGSPAEIDGPGLSLADLVSGLFSAIAVLTGLAARRAGRPASTFDVSMFDTLVSLLSSKLGPIINGAPPESDFGRDPGYGLFATADERLISLSISYEDKFWDALCSAVGLSEHAGIGAVERVKRREELRGDLAAVFATATLEEWETRLTGTEVPFGGVARLTDLAADAHVRARDLIQEVDGRRYVRQPLVVDGRPLGPRSGSPSLGEHTDAVIAQTAARSSTTEVG